MSFSSEHPLRPYYVAPAFHPDSDMTSRASNSSMSTSSIRPHSARQRYYNARMEDILSEVEEQQSEPGALLRSFLTTTIMGYGTSAVMHPFDVGKTLLQVQWIPRSLVDAELMSESGESLLDESALGEDDGYSSDEEHAEDYFTDLNARPTPPKVQPSPAKRSGHSRDSSGYLMRRSVFDEATKPEYTLPVVVTGGVWDMMRSIGRWSGEGWLSLWKGQLTGFVTASLNNLIQPSLLSFLNSVFASPASLPSLPLVHSPTPAVPLVIHVASHLITGLVLSPLELIRTRLVVQSCQPSHRRYEGPVDALYKVLSEEGGWRGIYMHSNLLWPAFIEHLLAPLLRLGSPLLLERVIGLSPSSSPALYALAEFALNAASLIVILPIETVRKRLQLQYRGSARRLGLRTCVETRPRPYVGMVEATYRILTEETGTLPKSLTRKAKLHRQRSGGVTTMESPEMQSEPLTGGLRQLYRGFGLSIMTQGVVLILSLAGGRDSGSTGWAEV